jgi:hypothetical protein
MCIPIPSRIVSGSTRTSAKLALFHRARVASKRRRSHSTSMVLSVTCPRVTSANSRAIGVALFFLGRTSASWRTYCALTLWKVRQAAAKRPCCSVPLCQARAFPSSRRPGPFQSIGSAVNWQRRGSALRRVSHRLRSVCVFPTFSAPRRARVRLSSAYVGRSGHSSRHS